MHLAPVKYKTTEPEFITWITFGRIEHYQVKLRAFKGGGGEGAFGTV